MYPTDEANPDAFMVCEQVKRFSICAVDAKMAGNHASSRVTLLNRMDQLTVEYLEREKKTHWFGKRQLQG